MRVAAVMAGNLRLGAARSNLSSARGLRWRADRSRGAPAALRRGLPDGPGRLPLPGRRRRGPLRRQGALDPQARRLALLDPVDARRRRDGRAGRRRSSSCVAATEAEALLAEQSFIKRHRPRFNIRLRDDKSYPYIAIRLDEDFPRVYFTRERHRRNRALLRPVLERQARARDARPARQALPVPHLRGRRARAALRRPLPRLLHQALRGALRRLRRHARSTARRSTASIAFLSGRYREIERDARGAG